MRTDRYGLVAAVVVSLVVGCVAGAARAADDDASLLSHVTARGSMANSFLRFERDHAGTVAFIGGSITEMNGYRPMVCEMLKKRFPHTQFKFIDAGISSTTSTTGAFRVARDVLNQGAIDLFFVEFAVNDDQDGKYTRQECIRGMEGLIRHARRTNPNVDIVMTFFTNEKMISAFQAGKTPLNVEAHEAVAARYDVPTINLAAEVASQISAGRLTWKKYGGVHPAPFGNAICAHMIELLLTRAWATPPAADAKPAPHAMPEPVDPLCYELGHFIDPKEAKIIKGFSLSVPDWKKLPGGKRERFTSMPMLHAAEAGAEASLEFDGTAIGAFIVAGPDAGIAEASIDGGAYTPVNLFHDYSHGLHYPRTVMFATDLKPGKHTLSIRISAETHSNGHAMRIMQFAVNGK